MVRTGVLRGRAALKSIVPAPLAPTAGPKSLRVPTLASYRDPIGVFESQAQASQCARVEVDRILSV
jgi:hypothetical protein